MSLDAYNQELKRTGFGKKTVSRKSPKEVLDFAESWFRERGYRAGRTGRPDHLFVMGGREGNLPRVTGEISARSDVGRPGITLVTLSAAGERLGPLMAEFLAELRRQRTKASPKVSTEMSP